MQELRPSITPTLERLAEMHADIIGNSPAEAAAFIREEKRRWGDVIRAANIKPD